jgi:hypothetical protein
MDRHVRAWPSEARRRLRAERIPALNPAMAIETSDHRRTRSNDNERMPVSLVKLRGTHQLNVQGSKLQISPAANFPYVDPD